MLAMVYKDVSNASDTTKSAPIVTASAEGASEKNGGFSTKNGGGAPPPFYQTPHETLEREMKPESLQQGKRVA